MARRGFKVVGQNGTLAVHRTKPEAISHRTALVDQGRSDLKVRRAK